MRNRLLRGLGVVVAAALVPACGGGGGGGGTGGGGGGGILSMSCSGGSTSGSTTAGGTAFAGQAGYLTAFSRGNIRFGEMSASVPPPLPTPSLSGTTITTASVAAYFGTVNDGNALVSGTVVTPGGATTTITAVNGDIVVSGSLLSGSLAGVPDTIVLSAPVGTVYITGSIRTSVGLTKGAYAGTLFVKAQRIIITGSIDTRGDPNSAGDGGEAGFVSLDTTSGSGGTSIYALGSINTSGGSGTTKTTNQGSTAGQVIMRAIDEVWMAGALTAIGGSVNGSAGGLTAGSGGSVFVNGGAGVSVNATIDLSGGGASTTGVGAASGLQGATIFGAAFIGGNGGTLNINVPSAGFPNPSGPVSMYGTFTSNGGAASAASGTVAAPICGGDCGGILIGANAAAATPGAPASVDFGNASLALRGGNSGDVAGFGGYINLFSTYTAIPMAGNIVFKGSADLTSGSGGNQVTPFGPSHVILQANNGDVILSGSLTLGGGSGSGDLSGVTAPIVSVLAGVAGGEGNIQSSATIIATGPSSTGSNGGVGGSFTMGVQDIEGIITLLPGSFISANGGTGGGATGAGGQGGALALMTSGNGVSTGTISVSGTILAQGGAAGHQGGLGGRLYGDTSLSGGVVGGDFRIETGALIDLSGGTGAFGGNARNNGVGGPTATRTPLPSLGTTALELWTHGSGTTPADPAFPIPAGGRLINNGTVRCNGGASNGGGGDITIDAFQADGSAAVTFGTIGSVTDSGVGGSGNGTITLK